MHASIVTLTLRTLIYLIGNGATMDFGLFVISQLSCHVDSYALKLLTTLLQLLSALMLSQHLAILFSARALGPFP